MAARSVAEEGQRASRRAQWPLARIHAALEAQREYWLIFQTVLFGTGVGLYFALPLEPQLWAIIAVVALAGLAYAGSKGLAAILLGSVMIAAAGSVAAKIRTEWVRAPVIEKRIGPVTVSGYVALVEPMPKRGQRLTLDVTAIEGRTADQLPSRVRIRAMKSLAGAKPGDAVTMRGTLAPPSGPALPAGYDFARMAWYQGLGGMGYSLSQPQLDASAAPAPLPLRIMAGIARVRQDIGQRIVSALPGEVGGIANALITGERGGISQATNDAYRDAGLYHILSISGLHMVVMAGAVFSVVRLLLACFPSLALTQPIKKWAAVAAALGALGYLLISGSAFATVRSYIMITIMFAAVLMDRPALALRNVALAALLILILYPESLLDVGFQMSFAAVVSLVAAYEWIRAKQEQTTTRKRSVLGSTARFFGGIILSTIVAGVSVAPFAAYHFHTSQQYAVLANLVTIPVCNFIVMPAALLAMVLMPFGLEWIALAVMGAGIDVMTWCAKWTAAIPGAVSHIRAIPLSAFLLMLAGGLWVTLWPTRRRGLGFGLVAAGLALAPFLPRPDILVGRDGALVAVRGDDGHYTALVSRSANFELKRWLEHDGDAREARAAIHKPKVEDGVRCDGIACNVAIKKRTVAMVRHPAALRDDCARADVLILDIPPPKGCDHPGNIIDFFSLRNLGTHAVYFEGDSGTRIETVAQYRGERPWAPPPRLPQPHVVQRATAEPAASDVAAPPVEPELRPELEGDDDESFGQE